MHGAAGLVLDLARELAAGRIDIVATRLARGGDDAGVNQDTGKTADAFRRGTQEAGIGERVEGNEVELARRVAHQRHELARMGVAVVYAVEHDVLEGDEVARRAL